MEEALGFEVTQMNRQWLGDLTATTYFEILNRNISNLSQYSQKSAWKSYI